MKIDLCAATRMHGLESLMESLEVMIAFRKKMISRLGLDVPCLCGQSLLTVVLFLSPIACVEGEFTEQAGCEDETCDRVSRDDADDRDTLPYLDDLECKDDPLKDNPGICGCGVPDEDRDGDGYMDCVDECAEDPDKLKPGICGCGVADTNSDGDSLVDCLEGCPQDPLKLEPGNCGCGNDEAGWLVDDDADGIPNCLDGCKTDPQKDAPGGCGCGVPDIDSDRDGTPDCVDQCIHDAGKISPGICGCGVADDDRDGDGSPDCRDNCPLDSAKTEPGICGCARTEEECIGRSTLDVADAMVNESHSRSNYDVPEMSIDLENDPGTTYVLLKPQGMEAIPYGSTVLSAELEVVVFDGGDRISLRKLLEPFEETKVTYRSRPDHTEEIGTLSGKKGRQSTDVKSVVQDWVDGEPTYGIALYPTGANGADIYSSEYSVESERPRFRIVYRYPD